MLSNLSIRQATDEDAESISQLICENAKTLLRPHYNDQQWNIFIKYYSPDVMRTKIREQYFFCAEIDKKIVGTIALDQDFVVGFYTRLEYLHKGIGKAMMQHLEKFAREKKFSEIQLAASPEGLTFYYKNGWEKVKDTTMYHYGVGFEETLMIKRLS